MSNMYIYCLHRKQWKVALRYLMSLLCFPIYLHFLLLFSLALTTYYPTPAQRGEGEVLPVWDSVWLGLQQQLCSESAFSFSFVQEASQCQTMS